MWKNASQHKREWVLERCLECLHPLGGQRTIDNAVVRRDRRLHHLHGPEALVRRLVRHKACLCRADRQDTALRRVDDRREVGRAHHAHVRNRERAALVFFRLQLAVARLLGELLALLANLGKTNRAAVPNDRRNEAVRRSDGHTNVLCVVLTNILAVPRRVSRRHLLQSQRRSLDDKVIHRQLRLLRLGLVATRCLCRRTVEHFAQLQNTVHLNIKRDIVVRHRRLALGQALGNGTTHVRQGLIRVRWRTATCSGGGRRGGGGGGSRA